ncbi:helix-turn-helix domain-containing protein [Chelativorans sp. ZYF759]|uniref:IclR family transcriptional regulator n=1 Tax=Chelativorans sp. ZYF759 TaxID=2692213 RepID=UPI00145D7C03|nr:IclR family transcriptional regulator [Chelativorans sp. ZYF759]NMG40662.1 helix-turn-helix domain-containing protein [Chelativorans sp. ZYF759]
MTDKKGNSLERVLAVLEVFTEDRLEWTPEQLMEELGYSRPTLYRYLKTLKEAGLLSSMPNAGFTLGPKVVEMDYLLRQSDPLILKGERHLAELTRRFSCTTLLVRWYGNRILCVDSRTSAKDPLSSYPRGRPMPMGRGAIARSIIAFLPRRHILPRIEASLEDLRSVGLGATVEEIHDNLKRVRKAGYAVAKGEVTPGVVGVAAPVFDAGQSPIASLCVTIAAELVDTKVVEEIGTCVREAAASLSAELSADRRAPAERQRVRED